jgi:hypothetical protein
MARIVQASFEFLAKHQRHKAAKHMAPDVLITLMVFRSGLK